MRVVLRIAVAVIVGLLIGGGSAVYVLYNGQLLGSFEKDYWFGNDKAGSNAADPYTRGIVAAIGLLALNKSETIYFHRYKDERGGQLSENCIYELRGAALPARWWSITVYADDNFLPVNQDRAFSADATQMVKGDDGAWAVRLAPERGEAKNWISTKAARKFSLALRMYNPDASARDDQASIPFPAIVTVSCAGGSP
jgi:hypothetical protein